MKDEFRTWDLNRRRYLLHVDDKYGVRDFVAEIENIDDDPDTNE